jgi:hypothetical protein
VIFLQPEEADICRHESEKDLRTDYNAMESELGPLEKVSIICFVLRTGIIVIRDAKGRVGRLGRRYTAED